MKQFYIVYKIEEHGTIKHCEVLSHEGEKMDQPPVPDGWHFRSYFDEAEKSFKQT